MSYKKGQTKYRNEFKKTIVNFTNQRKSYADIQKEYGVSSSALFDWVKKYSQVRIDDNTALTANQIKVLQ